MTFLEYSYYKQVIGHYFRIMSFDVGFFVKLYYGCNLRSHCFNIKLWVCTCPNIDYEMKFLRWRTEKLISIHLLFSIPFSFSFPLFSHISNNMKWASSFSRSYYLFFSFFLLNGPVFSIFLPVDVILKFMSCDLSLTCDNLCYALFISSP